MEDQTEQRFIEIEIKLANQENLLEQLNTVIYEQQKTLDQLQRILKELGKTNSLEIGPHNVKPPHY